MDINWICIIILGINMVSKYIDSDGTELEIRELSYYLCYLDNSHRYHRLDGPAIIYDYGEDWYRHNKLHRIGGPAIIRDNGRNYHWVNGIGVEVYYIDG